MSDDPRPQRAPRFRLGGAGSLMTTLARSLMLGLSLLWLIGVIGSGYVLQRLIDGKSDDELQETGLILASVIGRSPDLNAVAVVLSDAQARAAAAARHDRFAYRVIDNAGNVLLRSANAPATDVATPVREGLVDLDGWRVATLADRSNGRYLQVADPLAERREALVSALLWLTAPLAVLLAFAAFMVLRASRSLMGHVQRTAAAVGERDPQAMGILPLSGVVTEMRPAVEATNRLLGRVSHALETERSFTYNSAHELRTPIAAALAQVQLMASMCEGPPELKVQAARLIESMVRLSRLAERLLALARAEGAEPLVSQWVDLPRVVRLTVDEFRYDARLRGRKLVVAISMRSDWRCETWSRTPSCMVSAATASGSSAAPRRAASSWRSSTTAPVSTPPICRPSPSGSRVPAVARTPVPDLGWRSSPCWHAECARNSRCTVRRLDVQPGSRRAWSGPSPALKSPDAASRPCPKSRWPRSSTGRASLPGTGSAVTTATTDRIPDPA
jgi:two-component system OmpR family sensor kinase